MTLYVGYKLIKVIIIHIPLGGSYISSLLSLAATAVRLVQAFDEL